MALMYSDSNDAKQGEASGRKKNLREEDGTISRENVTLRDIMVPVHTCMVERDRALSTDYASQQR